MNIFKKNAKVLLTLSYLQLIISVVFGLLLSITLGSEAPGAYASPEGIAGVFTPTTVLLGLVFLLVITFITAVVSPAQSYVLLEGAKHRDKATGFLESWKVGLRFAVPFLLFILVIGIILIPFYLLFIVPGVILTILLLPRLILSPFVILDEKTGPIATLKKAGELSKKGGVWPLLVLMIGYVIGVSILAGALKYIVGGSELSAFFVDLLTTAAFLTIAAAPALLYKELK